MPSFKREPLKPNFWKKQGLRSRDKVFGRFQKLILEKGIFSEKVRQTLFSSKIAKWNAFNPNVQQQVLIADILRRRRKGQKITSQDMIAAGEFCEGFRKGKNGERIRLKDFERIKKQGKAKPAVQEEAIVERIRVKNDGKNYTRVMTKRFGLVWVDFRLDENDLVERHSMDFGIVAKGKDMLSFYQAHEESAREMLANAIEQAIRREDREME